MNPVASGSITLNNVSVRFKQGRNSVDAVSNVSLTIHPGEFVVLLGPSGCGKSTLLNAIAGFHTPAEGAIRLNGEPVTRPGPERGMVFQHHSLFPWKSVLENVAFGLKMRGIASSERRDAARDILKWVGLNGFEKHYPAQLSGGMQQRVGIARVLVNQPSVMLMDEPFGSLDAQTRLLMQELLLNIWEKFKTTVIFVTHDVDEAILLADRIIVMSSRPGRVKAQVAVDFARPRRAELTTLPQFSVIKRQCLDLIREESFKVFSVESKSASAPVQKEYNCEPTAKPLDATKTEVLAQSSSESRRFAAMVWRN